MKPASIPFRLVRPFTVEQLVDLSDEIVFLVLALVVGTPASFVPCRNPWEQESRDWTCWKYDPHRSWFVHREQFEHNLIVWCSQTAWSTPVFQHISCLDSDHAGTMRGACPGWTLMTSSTSRRINTLPLQVRVVNL